MALLEASDIVAGYGQTEILHSVSVTVDAGEMVTIIGPNGCGKSTLMKAIVGLVRVRSGSVKFQGAEISGDPPERIVRTRLCYVPQSNNVFHNLSIREKPGDGRLHPPRRLSRPHRRDVRAVPGPGAAAESEGRNAVRRSAARCWRLAAP